MTPNLITWYDNKPTEEIIYSVTWTFSTKPIKVWKWIYSSEILICPLNSYLKQEKTNWKTFFFTRI